MNKVQVQSRLNSEIYQQLKAFMTEKGLSEATAIEAIMCSYFADRPQAGLAEQLTKIEQELSDLKRHVLAIRFHA
jgi:hypothetical protein